MSSLYEKPIDRKAVYKGKVLDLYVDTVELPNGESAIREMCEHVGAVAVIALTDDGRVVMERQYRHPHGRVFLEIPAGKLNSKDENHLEAAARELREETGAVASELIFLSEIDTTPALIDEKIYLYLARGLSFGERSLDDDEFLDVELIPLKELVEMVKDGTIKDAKTVIAILRAALVEGVTSEGEK